MVNASAGDGGTGTCSPEKELHTLAPKADRGMRIALCVPKVQIDICLQRVAKQSWLYGLEQPSNPAAAKGCLQCRLLCALFFLTQVLEELHSSSVAGSIWTKQERACILMT